MLFRSLGNASALLVPIDWEEPFGLVMIEAMACGTPVIASNIPGNPEVVQTPEAGRIMAENTPQSLAAAVHDLFATNPNREATQAYAQPFSWDATTTGQLDIFRRVISK